MTRTVGAALLVAMAISGCSSTGARTSTGPASRTHGPANIVAATIPLTGQPLTVSVDDNGKLWVGRAETPPALLEIDPATDALGREVSLEVGLAATACAGSIWLGTSNALERVDPRSAAVTATVPTDSQQNAVGCGFGSAWSADWMGNQLLRIDTSSNTVAGRLGVMAMPSAIATSADRLWVGGSGSLLRVDPTALQTDGSVGDLEDVLDVAVLGGESYVLTEDFNLNEGWVVGIDASSLKSVGRVQLPSLGYHLLAADGSLWVSLTDRHSVARLDAKTLTLLSEVPVGGGSQAMASTPGSVWVAVTEPAALVRISTGS